MELGHTQITLTYIPTDMAKQSIHANSTVLIIYLYLTRPLFHTQDVN